MAIPVWGYEHNDPLTQTLARRFVRHRGESRGMEKWVLGAAERIKRGETTLDFEVKRLQRRFVMW